MGIQASSPGFWSASSSPSLYQCYCLFADACQDCQHFPRPPVALEKSISAATSMHRFCFMVQLTHCRGFSTDIGLAQERSASLKTLPLDPGSMQNNGLHGSCYGPVCYILAGFRSYSLLSFLLLIGWLGIGFRTGKTMCTHATRVRQYSFQSPDDPKATTQSPKFLQT